MDLYNIDIKPLKSKFSQILLVMVVSSVITYILVEKDVYLLENFDPGRKFTSPILTAMVILAALHTFYQRQQLNKLTSIEDFDLRVSKYQRFYNFRLLWFLFSCLISCALAILTGRKIFFYFALVEIFLMLIFYPTLTLLKRELKNDDIIVH